MSSLMLAGALNLEETYGWGGLSSTRRSRNQSSAGFLTCCVADFPVGMIWKVRGGGGLGNPRYSRLGSLRYGKKSSQPRANWPIAPQPAVSARLAGTDSPTRPTSLVTANPSHLQLASLQASTK